MAGPEVEHPLPWAGMTALEMLDIESIDSRGCWHTLKSWTAVNCITKLICRDEVCSEPNLPPLQSFTALKHLVIIHGTAWLVEDVWAKLVLVTWVTTLDIGRIIVTSPDAFGYTMLLQTLGTMMHLVSLSISCVVVCCHGEEERDAVEIVIAGMKGLSCLVSLVELSILCEGYGRIRC